MKFDVTEEERELIRQKMAQLPTRQIGAYLRKMAIFIPSSDVQPENAEFDISVTVSGSVTLTISAFSVKAPEPIEVIVIPLTVSGITTFVSLLLYAISTPSSFTSNSGSGVGIGVGVGTSVGVSVGSGVDVVVGGGVILPIMITFIIHRRVRQPYKVSDAPSNNISVTLNISALLLRCA